MSVFLTLVLHEWRQRLYIRITEFYTIVQIDKPSRAILSSDSDGETWNDI